MKFRLDKFKVRGNTSRGRTSTFWISKSSDEEVWASIQREQYKTTKKAVVELTCVKGNDR